MDRNAVFTATALSSFIAIVIMAFYANLPIALAPGMGLNAFFAYTVVTQMGYSWEMALTAVFIEGIIFILLTFFRVREAIIDSIPINLKHAISVGIGLYIALIGLSNAGSHGKKRVPPWYRWEVFRIPMRFLPWAGSLSSEYCLYSGSGEPWLSVSLPLHAIGIPLGITHMPEKGLVSLPPSLAPVFFKFDFSKVFTGDMLVVIFTFLFVDIFDTVGTLVGVCSKANLLDEKGRVPQARQALFADAVGTAAGAVLGTSTVTSYIESAAGVAERRKNGTDHPGGGNILFAVAFLCPAVPDDTRCGHSSGPRAGRIIHDQPDTENKPGRLFRIPARVPHNNYHAAGIQHFRRHCLWHAELCIHQTVYRQVETNFPCHVHPGCLFHPPSHFANQLSTINYQLPTICGIILSLPDRLL